MRNGFGYFNRSVEAISHNARPSASKKGRKSNEFLLTKKSLPSFPEILDA